MFWGEAVRHSVYILNKLPTRVLKGETPYEAWNGFKPKIDHVKVFGCLTHMKIAKVHTGKLDDRSKEVVYLGKEPGTKAYRLYDPFTGRLHVSKDVVFEELKSWNWTQPGMEGIKSSSSFIIINANVSVQQEEDADFATPVPSSLMQTEHSWDGSAGDSGGPNDENYDGNTEPRHFRLLSDVYNETDEVELIDELMMAGIEEPICYSQEAKDVAWKKAMQEEINSIEKNKMWVLTDLPPGRKAISLKSVYKIKKDTNGDIVKYKARLVARGFVQKKGVDFKEVFAPVTRLEMVRLLLALAAKNEWQVHHLDVKSAFLSGELLEEVYVTYPEGFVKEND